MIGWLEGSSRWNSFARGPWIGYLAALAAVALISLLIGLILSAAQVASISMLYLVAVLLTAIWFGRGPAIAASIVAFLVFNWFFVPPVHTLVVSASSEWIALLLFLLVAIITSQLSAEQRLRAEEAKRREREAVVLYDVLRLVNQPDIKLSLQAVAERLMSEMSLAAVGIELYHDGQVIGRAAAGQVEALRTTASAGRYAKQQLGDGTEPTGEQPGAPGRWIRIMPPHSASAGPPVVKHKVNVVPVKTQNQHVGDILVVQRPGGQEFSAADCRLLSGVAAQLGLWAERARLQEEATEAEILRRTDELKTALLNAVTHDLRTPLASIIASAASLRQCSVEWTDTERKEFEAAIEDEAQRLNRIVGNLLDLSRIEGGNLQPLKAWYDLGALIDDVVGRLRTATANHVVKLSIPEDLPPLYIDYVEIDQVLSNLIENAAKYSPAGTEIEVSAVRKGEEVVVEIADRGQGIASSEIPRLFEPFYRSPGAGSQTQGTGLGLAVAKGLVEAHGGRIQLENRIAGGIIARFTLPVMPCDRLGDRS